MTTGLGAANLLPTGKLVMESVMSQPTEQRFDVEGQVVRCTEIDGDRLWHCGCEAFQERLSRVREGFCAHTAVAMVSAMAKGLQR